MFIYILRWIILQNVTDNENYTVPVEQRQMYVIPAPAITLLVFLLMCLITTDNSIRILYMPPIYAIISFLSYRYFWSFTNYEVAEVY